MTHTQDPFAGDNAALFTEFIAQAEVKERTRLKYRTHLVEFDRWFEKAGSPQAEGNVRKVQSGDIARFMAYLRSGDRWAKSDVKKVGRDTPSPSTRKNFHASLSSFYRYLTAVGLVSHNPVLAIDAPKVPHKPGLHLTEDEVRRLLEWPGRPRERAQVFPITFTGARSDEIRSLRWQDIDLPNQTMLIRGKGDKYRVIDIHPRLMAELRRCTCTRTCTLVESITYIVCAGGGLDTSCESVPYVAGWDDDDLEPLRVDRRDVAAARASMRCGSRDHTAEGVTTPLGALIADPISHRSCDERCFQRGPAWR